MAITYYFYDLETSGFRAGSDRIMQFGGQRTDTDFNPIGKPDNILVKLPDDILPTPSAVLFTGLSLKENQAKGISEPEFARIFNQDIAKEGTVFIGFNNLRFDDEFIRYLNYRNFYDPYAWHWSLNRSRWDLLDAIRMTRALRPDGIDWPIDNEGKATNRLELLTTTNKLKHAKAHDALSDVLATIEVAKLLNKEQPKLFSYLIKLRDKKLSNQIIGGSKPFVYTSGKYSSEFLHTSVVMTMDFNPSSSTAQVYDLRIDPKPLLNMTSEELKIKWRYNPDKPRDIVPLKTIKLNRCPAVVPVSVLEKESLKRLKIDPKIIKKHEALLIEHKEDFIKKLNEVVKELNKERDNRQRSYKTYADQNLYSGFISSADQQICAQARHLPPQFDLKFKEKRLDDLYLIYLGRNYNDILINEQNVKWHDLVYKRIFSGKDSQFNRYQAELSELKKTNKNTKLIAELEERAVSIESEYGKPELVKDV